MIRSISATFNNIFSSEEERVVIYTNPDTQDLHRAVMRGGREISNVSWAEVRAKEEIQTSLERITKIALPVMGAILFGVSGNPIGAAFFVAFIGIAALVHLYSEIRVDNRIKEIQSENREVREVREYHARLRELEIRRPPPRHQVLLINGADFIQQDLLANDRETIDLFKSMDPSSCIYMFIITKAIYIYTFGAKKGDEVPDFFKRTTKKLILALRKQLHDEKIAQTLKKEMIEELERLMTRPTEFEIAPKSELTQAVFNELRKIASEELKQGLLITKCWQKAIEQLEGCPDTQAPGQAEES